MADMVWKPDVTVAAVVEREGQFLLIEERVSGRIVINQPAGHLENGETLIAAVARETLEETGWTFEPEAIVGVYLWRPPQTQRTFLRIAFCGPAIAHDATRALDHGIPLVTLFQLVCCVSSGPGSRIRRTSSAEHPAWTG